MKKNFKPIKEIYPVSDSEYSSGWYDYEPLLQSFGYNILLKVDDHNYQGDSRLLFQNDSKYGILIFGRGSCSGCDALQTCSSYNDLENLRESLWRSIQWFDSPEECLNYFENHDWEGDYSWHCSEMGKFISEAKTILKFKINEN